LTRLYLNITPPSRTVERSRWKRPGVSFLSTGLQISPQSTPFPTFRRPRLPRKYLAALRRCPIMLTTRPSTRHWVSWARLRWATRATRTRYCLTILTTRTRSRIGWRVI
ncbi:hypothetical protein LTR33_014868, partial [Friedmanniomyces endolithicus]